MAQLSALSVDGASATDAASQGARRRWLGPLLLALSLLAIALGASVGSTGLDALWRAAQDPRRGRT